MAAASGGQATKPTESNAVLKLKFQKLHATVVKSVNAANIIDVLFQEAVIGEEDLHTLQAEADARRQCRSLLSLLHNSENPEAFVLLYLAINDEPHLGWLIERIDQLTDPSVVSLQMEEMSVIEPTITGGMDVEDLSIHTASLSQAAGKSTTTTSQKTSPGSRRQFLTSARLLYQLVVEDDVWGVTQLRDVVYIVCAGSSTISRHSAATRKRLTDIDVTGLRYPWDIAACEQTSQVYVADSECIWRVSSDGEDIQRWLPKSYKFLPTKLSVTSSRLLVTSRDQLMQFESGGDQVRCVDLPNYMVTWHAVESPSDTFIVSHTNTQLDRSQISEVNTEGQVLRQFSSLLDWPLHVAVDSRGNIFVADHDSGRILLLDAQLALPLVIIDERQLKAPRRLCYKEQSGQLLVATCEKGWFGRDNSVVTVFDVLQR